MGKRARGHGGKYGPRNRKAARVRSRHVADISLNTSKPKGKQVMVGEVAPYALQMHPPCRGTGIQRGTRDVPCRCATLRFFKAHPEIIIEASGQAWWPQKEEKTDGKSSGAVEPGGADAGGAGAPATGTGEGGG